MTTTPDYARLIGWLEAASNFPMPSDQVSAEEMYAKAATALRTLLESNAALERDGYRTIFNAALTGICANPNFFGPIFQQSPQAAVDFANEVTLAAIYGDKYLPPHERAASRKDQNNASD